MGSVTIESINQIGDSIKYDQRSRGFILARRGSVFSLYAHLDADTALPDFRDLPSIPISLETGGMLMSVSAMDGKAEAIAVTEPFPSGAIFHYVRRKFDGTAVSIRTDVLGEERWLRHCNSRLMV